MTGTGRRRAQMDDPGQGMTDASRLHQDEVDGGCTELAPAGGLLLARKVL